MAKEKQTPPEEELTAPTPEEAAAQQPQDETEAPEAPETEATETETSEVVDLSDELAQAKAELKKEHENYLRLAAEYDNFRKRSQKERESLYNDLKAETTAKFLPVFDNLERALAQETADASYKKGVEMTMTGLREVLDKLEVKTFGAAGESFDPSRHNAVMHMEDDSLAANVIAEVFQKGFEVGGKVVRFAMVKVAN